MQIWEEYSTSLSFLENPLDYCPDEQDEICLIQNVFKNSFKNEKTEDIELALTLRNNKKRILQSKKRWVNAAIKDYEEKKAKKPKELLDEYLILKGFYERFGSSRFKENFKKERPEEVISERIDELKKWSEDKKSLLSNYPYIKFKSNTQIQKSITYDLINIIGDTIMAKYDGKIQGMIVEEPSSLVDFPIFSDGGKMPLSEKEVKEKEEELEYYNDYIPGDEFKLRTFVSSVLVENKKQIRYLDDTDREIFDQVMKQKSSLFATQRKIFVNIGQIVKNAYNSDNSKNYNAVASRLLKMGNMRFEVKRSESNTVSFGIFDYVDIEYNKWTAEITVNETIHQEYLNKETIRMYKDVIKKLELPLSKSLIFILQKERFLRYSTKQSYKQWYDYSFFSHKLQLKRSKLANYKLIEASLKEIAEHEVAVKSFYRKSDTFYIEYYEVLPHEIEDLIHSSITLEDFSTPPLLES